MADGTKLERALAAAAADIADQGRRFALVGGLAVSVRAEVRFTRDVDLAVAVDDDADALSMDDERLQDRLDARNILQIDVSLDLDRVRANLSLIEHRGYARRQDLNAKLATLLKAPP